MSDDKLNMNPIKQLFSKIRPGSGNGPAHAISIIDTVAGRASDKRAYRVPSQEGYEPDPSSSSWPVILSADEYLGGPPVPTGILPGTDPHTGRMEPYAPDDETVIYRLFGMHVEPDD